jgi:hypothetical protein
MKGEHTMPEKKKKVQSDGSIPSCVVNQVGEHAVGGFILFYFNSETGIPQEVISVDSPAHALALQKHIEDWQCAVNAVNHNMAVEAIENSFAESLPQEEEDEDDEN